MMNIPELKDDPVFVLAQNSADTAIIDAKNSNPDNKLANRIMGNDTIDLTTPPLLVWPLALTVDETRLCSYLV